MGASLLLKRALDRAAVWHDGQHRKYPGAKVPYVSHLAGVALRLTRHGFDEEVVAAGVLHDTIEDTVATHADLVAHFGRRVADLVQDCSEADRSAPWEVRKQQALERFATKSWDAQAISLADKIDNLESLVVCAAEHGNPWAQLKRGRDVQLQRFEALLVVARKLPSHPLVDEYAAAVVAATAVGPDGTLIG